MAVSFQSRLGTTLAETLSQPSFTMLPLGLIGRSAKFSLFFGSSRHPSKVIQTASFQLGSDLRPLFV
jgi:hypothetical protein